MLSQVQFNKKFGLPRPKRTNLEKKYFGNPNRHGWKETKGYIKKMFDSMDTADSKMAGRIQRQIRRRDRRAAKQQIELGLLDFELELEAQKAEDANDRFLCGYEDEERLYDFFLFYFQLKEDLCELDDCFEDFSESEEPNRLKGTSCEFAIVDEPQLMWQYKHEGD